MRDLDNTATQAHLHRVGINDSRVTAFAHMDGNGDVRYNWHRHAYHQLLYSFRGAGEVEVGHGRYFLPPQCAAGISAETLHRTTLVDCTGGSVFFQRKLIRWKTDPIQIIAAPPLLREMVKGATRWPPRSSTRDPLRIVYFQTLALLCKEWLAQDLPFWLPDSDHPQLSRALDYTRSNLGHATAAGAASAAAMSPRTFRRCFAANLTLSWQNYLLKARLLRAMHLLAQPGSTITGVALEIGFESPSAFSKAFLRQLLGANLRAGRKVRSPQGSMPANGRGCLLQGRHYG